MRSRVDVAAIVSGKNDPSSRFRVLQYVEALAEHNVALTPLTPMFSSYPPRPWASRVLWGSSVLAERLGMAMVSHRYDVTLLQRTMVSTLSTFEPLCRKPRIFDVDDAIHLYRGGGPARRVAKACTLVICGNNYLANWYSRYAPHIAVLPTAVDARRWSPSITEPSRPFVGWIGSSSNVAYLAERQDSLRAFFDTCPDWMLRVVSDVCPTLDKLPADRWMFVPWSPENEVSETAGFSIGLMPLRDTEWERGKCSYKMLLYMACGVPVVVSPVGMNREVLAKGSCGLAAVKADDWTSALVALAQDSSLRRTMGITGRTITACDYSIDVVAPKLANLISEVAEQGAL